MLAYRGYTSQTGRRELNETLQGQDTDNDTRIFLSQRNDPITAPQNDAKDTQALRQQKYGPRKTRYMTLHRATETEFNVRIPFDG